MGHEIWRIEHHYNPEYRHQKSAGQTSRQPATINAGGRNDWAVIFTHWAHWARNPENWAPLEARISPLEKWRANFTAARHPQSRRVEIFGSNLHPFGTLGTKIREFGTNPRKCVSFFYIYIIFLHLS